MTKPNPQPSSQPTPSTARPAAQPPSVSPEELKALIAALADPRHERYPFAEDELITIGAQAVPALIDALSAEGPWLRAYRAAEALGQIGDGRASRPLVAALRHPNSNVRWGAARALAKVGDSRALLPLRSAARNDRGKTSWGEPVASAAQVALRQMQDRSTVLRLSDPAKIAILVALAFFALWLANDRVAAFRTAVDDPTSAELWGTPVTPIIPTPDPTALAEEEAADDGSTDDGTTTDDGSTDDGTTTDDGSTEEATEEPADTTPTPTPGAITAEVTSASANIRPAPNTANEPIGRLVQGDTVQIVGQTGDWYQIVLPDSTGRGWVAASVLGPPSGPVPPATE